MAQATRMRCIGRRHARARRRPGPAIALIVLVVCASLAVAAPEAFSYAEFRTPGEAAYCGRGDGADITLLCWTPNDGFTVTMGVRERPRKSYLQDNRGYVENQARILGFGRAWRGGSFVCRSRASGLTCTNRRGHGWWLGRYVGYRLF